MLSGPAATCSRDQSPRYRGGSGATKSGTIDNGEGSIKVGCSRDRCVTRMIPSDFLKDRLESLLTIEIVRAEIFPVAAIYQRIEKCPQRVEYRGIATHEVLQDDTHPVHGFSP
jgi:hypothetical protein